MVTKSNFSSPPRVRGDPIDVQEIEVELASLMYSSSKKSTKHTLHHLASADSSSNLNSDPDPAASTAPSTPSTAPNSVQSEPNDREQPREPLPQQQQQREETVTTSENKQTTQESATVMRGRQANSPGKLRTPERPKPASGSKEDAEPSVVEVELSNSPAKSHASSKTPSSTAATPKSRGSKPSILSKGQRATTFPSIKPFIASAATAALIGTAAASEAKGSSVRKQTNATVDGVAENSSESMTSTAKSNQSMTSATKASNTSNSTNTTEASALSNQSMTSGTKSTKAEATISSTTSGLSKANSPKLSTPKSLDSVMATALTKSASAVAAFGIGKSAFKAPTKGSTPTKSTAVIEPPSTPPSATKVLSFKSAESRLSPVFRSGGKTNPVRDDALVVRDGKLCHVRLTLAFLTGVTAERLPESQHVPLHNGKRHSVPKIPQAENNAEPATLEEIVPLGYAMFSQGDGTMALSHPMKPLNFATNAPRQTLIWTDTSDTMSTANGPNDDDHDTPVERDDESQLTHNAGQRRLYFEVSLNREGDSTVPSESARDVPDDATATEMLKEVAANYSPELVPIVVGLKKGDDQVLPLGIATLVVSGREVLGQHMDLPVRPLTLAEREAFNTDPADKKKKKGPTFRFFGGGKREAVAQASFKNEQHCYSLAPNSTLRVRLDVRSGIYQEHGPALWGDILVLRPDDESRCTVTVYDMSTQGDRETIKRSLLPLDDRHEYVEVLSNPNGTTIISSPGGALGSLSNASQLSRLQGRDDESLQTRFEVTSIVAASTDVRSTDSTENFSLFARLENAGICGALDKLDDRAISSSNSFASTLPDVDPTELDSVQSGLSAAGEKRMEAPSSTSKHNNGTTKKSAPTGQFNAIDEDDDDDDDDGFNSTGASKSSGADSSTEAGTRTSGTTRSVGDETYEKVQEAKKTLLRYASRVGVEMEDLLVNDEDDSTFHRRESSTYSSSTDVSK